MTFQLAPAVILRGYINPPDTLANLMLSDHSRSAVDISYDKYEKSVQLANGLTRKYTIATKRSINLSWSDIPSNSYATVDYGAGARELQDFYEKNYNNSITVYVLVDQGSGTPTSNGISINKYSGGVISNLPTDVGNGFSYTAFIDSFSCNVNKRYYGGGTEETGRYDLWNVSMTLKEA